MLLRNEHEAEDAAQQTFLAAYRSMRNGVEPRHPAAWLATIARNEWWAAIERRMREPGCDQSRAPRPRWQRRSARCAMRSRACCSACPMHRRCPASPGWPRELPPP
jgi:DNA-directed RNA polymerase specialized sigma24 family protein